MTADNDQKAALLSRLGELAPWHMDIALSDDIRTVDGNHDNYSNDDFKGVKIVKPTEMLKLLNRLYPNGLEERTFLDVGCNAGGYCFMAGELGASSCYGFDVREHWSNQATFLHDTLYQRDPMYQFGCHHIDALPADRHYDITLFKGVFYHLPDPISSLAQLCDVTDELIIVDTAGLANTSEDSLTAVFESKSRVMSGVDGLSWLPGGPGAIRKILAWKGFTHCRVIYHTQTTENRTRMRMVAARSAETLQRLKGGTGGSSA